MRRLVESRVLIFLFVGGFAVGVDFACFARFLPLGASIRTGVSHRWARCIMVSDTEEGVLLSKGRPRKQGQAAEAQSPELEMKQELCKSETPGCSSVVNF
jgi:hypothetical protein